MRDDRVLLEGNNFVWGIEGFTQPSDYYVSRSRVYCVNKLDGMTFHEDIGMPFGLVQTLDFWNAVSFLSTETKKAIESIQDQVNKHYDQRTSDVNP